MRQRFTKMQGAGNDFVVLDATRAPLALSTAQLQHLGDRRFGVGADQILVVEPAPTPDIDFRYRIFNGASGDEVEHCGNGARCFVRFVRDHGLTDKTRVRVRTVNRVLELRRSSTTAGSRVDMGAPVFEPAALPFDAAGLTPRREDGFELWPLDGATGRRSNWPCCRWATRMRCSAWTMSTPRRWPASARAIERHPRFARRVNVGFLQVLSRSRVRLRVHERDAGETLACGTGACAAVVAGIRLGWLDAQVEVELRGGSLHIEWAGGAAGAHDRPGRDRLRRGDRDCEHRPRHHRGRHRRTTWRSTPGFFERHAELLASVQLTSPHGQRAVSLQERQMEMLRERIKGLELQDRRDDPPRPGERRHRRPSAPLDARHPAERRCRAPCPACCCRPLQHEFLIPQAALRLWGLPARLRRRGLRAPVSDDARTFAASLSAALLRR